jgi:DNA-binding transcriptional MerR regulator
MEDEKSVSELIQAAASAGFRVTGSQLRRWHRLGLVGPPRQQSLGRGRGTVTIYPPGALERVLAICRLRRDHRSLEDVRWLLWWGGDDIATGPLRATLASDIRALRDAAASLFTANGLSDEALNVLDNQSEGPLDSTPFRWARRRVGVKHFGGFLESVMLAATGHGEELLDEDVAIFERGLGLDRARADQLPSGEGWLTGDARSDIVAIGQLFNVQEFSVDLEAIGEEELRKARDEAKAFLLFITTVSEVIRTGFDRWAYGFGVFGALAQEMARSPKEQRRLLLMWLGMYTAELQEGMEVIVKQGAALADVPEHLAMIEELRDAVPAVGAAISTREIVRARFKPAEAQSVQEKLDVVRKEHGQEIDRFLSERAAHREEEFPS